MSQLKLVQENDIALLELAMPAKIGQNVNTICLASDNITFSGFAGIVTGYGVDSYIGK